MPAGKDSGHGQHHQKLNVVGCQVSATAKEKIEKAGGKIK